MNCITGAVDWTISYIKTIKDIAGALAVIKRTFGRIYPFNRVLGGW
jgi:hypothetical protein